MKRLSAVLDVLLPRTCAVCGCTLTHERDICHRCLDGMPLLRLNLTDFNAMEQALAGDVPIERAAAYMLYDRMSPYSQVLQDIKYRNVPQLGRHLAERAAQTMPHFFDGIDVIVPVPLHAGKRAWRGYNQSEQIARGLADVLHRPVLARALHVKPHPSQTQKNVGERLRNAEGMFSLSGRAERELIRRHVLLVDDVMTTGATLLACARQLARVPDVTISVFTLAWAAHR